MRFFLLVLIGLIGAIVGGSYLLQASPEKMRYYTAEVERRTIVESVAATGNAEPLEIFYVQCEIMGIVDQIVATYNDAVEQGQVLAKISSEIQRVKLESALADLETAETGLKTAEAGIEAARLAEKQAELQLNTAKRFLNDAQTQAQEELIPKTQVENRGDIVKQAEAGVEVARVHVKQAEAAYETAKSKRESANVGIRAANLELNKTELRSPAAGIILNVNCKIGDTVGRPRLSLSEPSPALFEIARSLDKMRAVVRVNEVDYSRVKVGQSVQFTVDAYPDLKFEGKVVQIRNSATSDRTAVNYDTVIEFENKHDPSSNEWMIRPRATCRADILVRRVDDALAVPNDALLFSPPPGQEEIPSVASGENLVWTVNASGKLIPHKVKIGVSDGFWTQIITGDLDVGQKVVTGQPASSESFKMPTIGN
ncbi:efflux RND transporter periplasmic adaptor subunit [bacterium]|nr:efflux RND transporter periplasmic adaptor subunit [bacterium]